MKKLIALTLCLTLLALFLTGCEQNNTKTEKFYGVIRKDNYNDTLIVAINGTEDAIIPKAEKISVVLPGYEKGSDYALKEGDLVCIQFVYETSWDDNSVKLMESYPARFDRDASNIIVIRENISYLKTDDGYVFKFPKGDKIQDAKVGDTIRFVLHDSTGTITNINDGFVTAVLSKDIENYETFLGAYATSDDVVLVS